MKVAVIGGGPSGLVALKHIVTAHQLFATDPIEAKLFELEESIGGKFKHHDYEEAEVRSLILILDIRKCTILIV